MYAVYRFINASDASKLWAVSRSELVNQRNGQKVTYWNTDSKSEGAAGAIQALFAEAIYF